MSDDRLDYVGVRRDCGCVTAWMSAAHSEPAEVQEFYAEMARTDREVRFMPLEDVRGNIGCEHREATSRLAPSPSGDQEEQDE